MKYMSQGHLKTGLDSLRTTKMRNFWTMLGVIIGVASVIIVVGIGEGVKAQISGQIHQLGKDVIIVRPSQLSATSGIAGLGVSSSLNPHDVGLVQNTRGVGKSAPLALVTGKVSGVNGAYTGGVVIGSLPDLPSLLNQSMAYGSFITNDDLGTNAAVIGTKAAESLFDEDVPLGRSFTFHGEQFQVRGIFNEFNSAPLGAETNFNNAVFIPFDTAERLSNNTAAIYEVLAKPASSRQADQVAGAIHHKLDSNHGGQSNLVVSTSSQNIGASNYILDLLTRLIAGVAAISLLVGGIGIMNVMLVSVAERTHEIGIRKAVGATNSQILSQFIVESTALSLAGGIIGIGVAYLVDLALRAVTNLQPQISWPVVVLAMGVSLLVGIIFGSFPALKAARKNPIEALRTQ